jgi:5-methyltetrahydrofolate--homocysteine methyltransferase
VIADGAMGTMLQRYDLTLQDFQQLEGCNEILNLTRPDIVRAIHDAYFDAGVDAVETNSFGANLSALGEYGIADRIGELAEAAARIARESADAYRTAERPRWARSGRWRMRAAIFQSSSMSLWRPPEPCSLAQRSALL